MIESNDLIVFALTIIGSFIGVNFGGSMLLVMPALLGLGFNPLTILCSTRPAIVLQSCLGLVMFREFRDINLSRHLVLLLSASFGALFGIYFLSKLNPNQALVLMLVLVIILSILASLKYVLIDFFRKDSGYFYPESNLLTYFICGFFPAIIGGLIGSGAGLIVVLFALILLRKNTQSASYLEKSVSLGHSLTVLVWSFFYGQFDLKIGLVVLLGTLIGAYWGAKVTLKLDVYWMYCIVIILCVLIIIKKIFW